MMTKRNIYTVPETGKQFAVAYKQGDAKTAAGTTEHFSGGKATLVRPCEITPSCDKLVHFCLTLHLPATK